jgi:hypothetical protein
MQATDWFIFDDPVKAPPVTVSIVPPFAGTWPIEKCGWFLNRFAEVVTWESSGDGRYAALHTWPEEGSWNAS